MYLYFYSYVYLYVYMYIRLYIYICIYTVCIYIKTIFMMFFLFPLRISCSYQSGTSDRYRIQAPEPVGDEIIVEVVPDVWDLAGVKHALVLLVLQK